jgi:hypothetical protein
MPYLHNPVVDDYNIRDQNFFDQVNRMKHISAYFGKTEQITERFAWWPVRSSLSNRLIWFSKYTEVDTYFDEPGSLVIPCRRWKIIYTPREYFLKKLSE